MLRPTLIAALALLDTVDAGLAAHKAVLVHAGFDFFHRFHGYIIAYTVGHPQSYRLISFPPNDIEQGKEPAV